MTAVPTSVADVEARMAREGFAEMRWLWRRFVQSGQSLESLQPAQLERERGRHMNALLVGPVALFSLAAGVGMYGYSATLFLGASRPQDVPIRVLFSAVCIYLFWFTATCIQRSLVHDWKSIASRELAAMLRHPSFRDWQETQDAAVSVRRKLQDLGVDGTWDSASYRMWYSSDKGAIQADEPASSQDLVRRALRDVLGSKTGQTFQPGRFYDHLTDRKKSVSRFVKAHQAALDKSRTGELPLDEGCALLEALGAEMIPDSAGHRHLLQVRHDLKQADQLPRGVVEARIWRREPWDDLTHAKDFYSSASLRNNTLSDSLERRTKGMLGPFGYLHNKSISALDFRTSEGRCVRARLAAAVVQDSDTPVLFVDAVEGRFDVRPALIRRAVEDYARAAGFAWVLYHALPLNRVPRRFIAHLAQSGVRLVTAPIRYVDARSREYLDAFGLPLEPFEYAYPAGQVLAYAVPLREELPPTFASPTGLQVAVRKTVKAGALPALVVATVLCMAWILYRAYPPSLVPAGAGVALGLLYENVVRPRLRLRLEASHA